MQSECTWMKPDVPVIYRTNFCMALLLSGHPQGCLSLLTDIKEQDHPSVQRVREALEAWQRGLTFWQRLQWKVGIEPETQFVLDSVPGDFIEPLVTPRPIVSTQDSPVAPASQAV